MSENIHIDGDRVIAFINAIKELAEILDQLNVIEVKDAFIHGKRLGSIESIIATQERWREAIAAIGAELRNNIAQIDADRSNAIQCSNTLRALHATVNSSESQSALRIAKEFVAVLDRLEHHNQAGTLKLLSSLTTKQ